MVEPRSALSNNLTQGSKDIIPPSADHYASQGIDVGSGFPQILSSHILQLRSNHHKSVKSYQDPGYLSRNGGATPEIYLDIRFWTGTSTFARAAAMQWKEGYPLDFKEALKTPSEAEISRLVSRSSQAPRFVYGPLMLPTVLKYFVSLPQHVKVDMVPATLRGFKLYKIAEGGLPTIVRSKEETSEVEGMLIFGLDDEQRNSIFELESGGGLTEFTAVQVQIYQEDVVGRYQVKDTRTVDAGTFIWSDHTTNMLTAVAASCWDLDDFLAGQFYENIVKIQKRSQELDDLD